MRSIVFIAVCIAFSSCDSYPPFGNREFTNISFDTAQEFIDGASYWIGYQKTVEDDVYYVLDLPIAAVAIVELRNKLSEPIRLEVFDESRSEYQGPISNHWAEDVQVANVLLDQGRYYFRVKSTGKRSEGYYFAISLELNRSDPFEFNNQISSATAIQKNIEYFPTLRPTTDVDFFEFDHEGGELSLTTTYGESMEVSVYDGAGLRLSSTVVFQRDFSLTTEQSSLGDLQEGIYYLKLKSYWPNPDTRAFAYQFKLE